MLFLYLVGRQQTPRFEERDVPDFGIVFLCRSNREAEGDASPGGGWLDGRSCIKEGCTLLVFMEQPHAGPRHSPYVLPTHLVF